MINETKVEYMMAGDTILYISDHGPRSSSTLAALEAIGYDAVSAINSIQAIALLFVMHSLTAVVLDQHSIEQSSFDLIHSIRALRPGVPIILLCTARVDRLPSAVDYCVQVGQALEDVTSDLKRILAEKPVTVGSIDCCSGPRPSM
jgi:response regulator RpfG family c-di-GMP phosphodiesterase